MSHRLAVAGTATGVVLLADVPSAAKRHVALPFGGSIAAGAKHCGIPGITKSYGATCVIEMVPPRVRAYEGGALTTEWRQGQVGPVRAGGGFHETEIYDSLTEGEEHGIGAGRSGTVSARAIRGGHFEAKLHDTVRHDFSGGVWELGPVVNSQ